MKKFIAIVMTLCLMMTAAYATASDSTAVFSIKDGVVFGMSQNELTAALGGARYEIDYENTRGRVSFMKVEVEHQNIWGLRADVNYIFNNDRLVAVHVDFDDNRGAYDQVTAKLNGAYQVSGAVDLAKLGNGIYAVDDDGRLEGRTECWTDGDVMIILERDHDGDVDVYLVDLTADYIR